MKGPGLHRYSAIVHDYVRCNSDYFIVTHDEYYVYSLKWCSLPAALKIAKASAAKPVFIELEEQMMIWEFDA